MLGNSKRYGLGGVGSQGLMSATANRETPLDRPLTSRYTSGVSVADIIYYQTQYTLCGDGGDGCGGALA